MPRKPRSAEIQAGGVYHLISRFVEQRFFITKPLERSMYLRLHQRALQRSDWRLLAFAIMSNHIHLAAIAGRGSLAAWLRPVHSPFADMLNKAHQRIGPIYVRGPKAYPVIDARVGHLLAYIHNNPVRAKVCASPAESTWTSHRAYVGDVHIPRFLDTKAGLSLARMSALQFDRFVNDPAQRADTSFSEASHEREQELQAEPRPIVAATEAELADAVVESTAAYLGVRTAALRSKSRGEVEVLGRSVAVRCSMSVGLPEPRIARALNISQQRVSVLRRRVIPGEVLALAEAVCAKLQLG
jgi:hypothetical protein